MKTTTLHVWLKLVSLSTLPQMSCHCGSWLKSGKWTPASSINAHTLFTLEEIVCFAIKKSMTISITLIINYYFESHM
jgi:hypothetical protein